MKTPTSLASAGNFFNYFFRNNSSPWRRHFFTIAISLMGLGLNSAFATSDAGEILVNHCADDIGEVVLLYRECPQCEFQRYWLKPNSSARIPVLDLRQYHPLYALSQGQKIARVGMKWSVYDPDRSYLHQFIWRDEIPGPVSTAFVYNFIRKGRDLCVVD